MALIHESLHLFAGYSDQALALAAKKLDGEKNPKPYALTQQGMEDASKRLNEYIGKNCKGVQVNGVSTTIFP